MYFDTMLASYLLNAGTGQHSLSTLSFNMLGYQMQPIEDLIGAGEEKSKRHGGYRTAKSFLVCKRGQQSLLFAA
ncbi:MAG: hypothetical protein R3B41_03665 [Candidatus Doudnabacteria bacterium]